MVMLSLNDDRLLRELRHTPQRARSAPTLAVEDFLFMKKYKSSSKYTCQDRSKSVCILSYIYISFLYRGEI